MLFPSSAGAVATGNGSAAASVAPNSVFGMGNNDSGQLGDGSTTNRALPVPNGAIGNAVQAAVGASWTVALHADGSVWASGGGYIGTGHLGGFDGSVAVAGGDQHVLGVKQDGTIIANGKDNHGQLGDGGDLPPDCTGCPDPPRPATISGYGAVAVAAGLEFSLALRSNGTVVGFGRSDVGQVADGVGTADDRTFPSTIAGLSNIDAVAAGYFNGYALRHDGTVWSWGYNDRGQLGSGAGAVGTIARSPVQVAGINNAVAIAAGGYHALALLSTGQVVGWGGNDYGAVGDGLTNYTPVPHPVVGLSNVKAIAAGFSYSLALKNDGTLWGWGSNYAGRLRGGGDPTEIIRTPVQIAGAGRGTTALATGAAADHIELVGVQGPLLAGPSGVDFGTKTPVGSTTAARTVTLTNDGFPLTPGSVSITGPDRDEFTITDQSCSSTPLQSGDSCTVTARFAPVAPGAATATLHVGLPNGGSGDYPMTGYATGAPDSVDLSSVPGSPLAWGTGTSGQLGNGASANSNVPKAFGSFADVVSVSAGVSHDVALRADGTVWSAGSNAFGQLGTGAPSGSQRPQAASDLSGVEAIAAGANHTLALRADGSVWAWGLNDNGQLGDGTMTNRNVPIRVRGLSNVVAIGAGVGDSVALRADGTVLAWGDGHFGQMGDGTFNSRLLPGPVSGLSGVVAISGGGYHNLAIKSDGTLWGWGSGNQGQLGQTTVGRRATPVQVPGLTNVVSVSGGFEHSLAAKSDGTLWSWGYNSNGQLGTGNTTQVNSPTQVAGVTGITSVSAGYLFSMARKSDGSALGWGQNAAGQLGNASNAQALTPVPITALNRGTGLLGAGPQAGGGMAVGVPNINRSASKLTFPNSPVGTPTAAMTVTFSNNGAAPMQVGTAAIVAGTGGGDADQFSISGDGCSQTTVPAAGNCVIGIRYTPLVSGTPVAFLRVPSNAQNGTMTVTLDPPVEDAASPSPGGTAPTPQVPSAPAQPAGHTPPVHAALASCKAGHLKHGRIAVNCSFAKRGKRAITARLIRGRTVYASGRAKARGNRVTLHLALRRKTKPGLYTLALSWPHGKARAAAIQTVLIKR